MSQTPNSPAIGDRRLHSQRNTSVHGTVLFPARRRLPVNRGSWRLNASIVDTAGQWWGRSWLSSRGKSEHEISREVHRPHPMSVIVVNASISPDTCEW